MGKTIVSWSPVMGQGSTSANTIGLASVMSLEKVHRSLLAIMQLTANPMEGFGRKTTTSEFDDSGIIGLERLVKSKLLKPDDVPAYTETIYKSHLDFLKGKKGKQLDDENLDVLSVILRFAREHYDFTWIDAESGIASEKTLELLTNADLVLINLPQSRHVIENFLSAVPNQLQNQPYIIILSQYDDKSNYSLRNIKRQNRIQVPFFTIPYATAYRDAINQNRIAEFFIRSTTVEKRDDLYQFFQSLKNINGEIEKQLGFANGEGDWE